MDCSHIPELKYSDFSLRLHGEGARAGLPLCGAFELTRRCNLRCAHCYLNLPLSAKGELSTEGVEEILSQMADEGCLWLLLTGGEPLVREDFVRLYTFAKKRGFLLTLFSNATLVTDECAVLLGDLKPFQLEVSVYGATPQTYERVTRVRGSFRRCMEGIERLAARGVPLCLKTVALTLNEHELPQMEALAARFGARFRFDPMITGRIDGRPGPKQVRLDPCRAVMADLSHPRRVRDWIQVRDRFSHRPPQGDTLFQCGAGVSSFYVDATGLLFLCPTARAWRYDLSRGNFREGWEEAKKIRRSWKRSRPSPCGECHLWAICGQCPGWSETEHGDPEARVEYLCQMAHLRATYLDKISPFRLKGSERRDERAPIS